MLFSEVYCSYFNVMAAVIDEAQKGVLDESRLLAIVGERAYSESMLSIIPAIKNEDWSVIDGSLRTPLKHQPRMPLTILQKRWLKTLLSDPRIGLFDIDAAGLDDVEPLFSYEDFIFFDRYADGDPYGDGSYREHFRMILMALKEKHRLDITYLNRKGRRMRGVFVPHKLEYSSKDDKFRLEITGGRYFTYINLARIEACELLERYEQGDFDMPLHRKSQVSFELKDERRALDRVMLHFSDCRKETRHLHDDVYHVDLWYDVQDETEILIRILSFGPMLKVVAPDRFVDLIKARLAKQIEAMTRHRADDGERLRRTE